MNDHCPYCGRCKHCGQPQPTYPWTLVPWPYSPWYQTPAYPFTGTPPTITWTVTSGTSAGG